ncbi:hypothetical protein [Xanthomonas sp. 3307]|uniref:TRAFAC clade GTPase domain-containing protein n=1 Tax=Xanthomonas sp. 3307 TaxID=3035316 RepID=UPI00161B0F42|nr:hypothetical protein [Xanthomonas sp. 3307]MBB5942853.1 hypothetical protein [Xanthomonas sp. 3307]
MTALFHSIIGLPRSGKTTFLAALWHQLEAGEISTRLTLDKLVGDHSYLNDIATAWRGFQEVPRTSRGADAKVSIHVRDTLTGNTVELYFPDLSGESYEDQFVARTCSTSYVDGFSEEGGILLFVTADKQQDGVTLLDLGPELVADAAIDINVNAVAATAWSHKDVPVQVRLVDLLQFLQHRPFQRRQRKLAVCVSAWDLIDGGITPETWLARELPLLNQFLLNNSESFEVRIYGVSAQGGDLAGNLGDLIKVEVPSRRVLCLGPEGTKHDLTAPIIWMSEEN